MRAQLIEGTIREKWQGIHGHGVNALSCPEKCQRRMQKRTSITGPLYRKDLRWLAKGRRLRLPVLRGQHDGQATF
jgi:hypothetical protein